MINSNTDILQTPYLYENNHSLLGDDNIGIDGENLTILVLSMNRSSLTIRLLHSISEHIPNFKGELLIVDNGSQKPEINILKNEMINMSYKNRIVEFETNYGTSDGRNKAINYVNTDWALCLDNDIYFISNPLNQIQKAISKLGCHFLNLPLLDATGSNIASIGGHLSLKNQNSKVMINGGTAYKQIDYKDIKKEPFLSTFLYAGASVIKKNTFLKLGGYDKEMFIGFEDIDFSIKLFRSGMKIGNLSDFFLIHDHKKPIKTIDIEYEKIRLSENILKESAQYFENKYGFSVFNEDEISWVRTELNKLENNIKHQIAHSSKNATVNTGEIWQSKKDINTEYLKDTVIISSKFKQNLNFKIRKGLVLSNTKPMVSSTN